MQIKVEGLYNKKGGNMREVKVGALYHHFKGHDYKVLMIGKSVDDLKEKVIYQNIDDTKAIWIRDKEEFLSKVDKEKYKDVEQIYRFELKSN